MKYLVAFLYIIFLENSAMAQEIGQSSKIKFNFSIELIQPDKTVNSIKTFVNVFSYQNLMLCEIPVYSTENLMPDKDGANNINITDNVTTYFYVLADYSQKKALKFKTLQDNEPTNISLESLYLEIFSFNEKFISYNDKTKISKYQVQDYKVVEYNDSLSTSKASTKLFFSDRSLFTNFSFSKGLEKERNEKLFKIVIREEKKEATQTMIWELSESKQELRPEILRFLKEHSSTKN